MLDSLRAFSRTWFAKIFFAVLVLSFALFGISNVIFDLGTSTVARVGDQEITIQQFQRAYQSQLNQMAQQYRPGADGRAGGGARHSELGDRTARRQRRDRRGRRRISASASPRPGSARCCARTPPSPARSAVSTRQTFVRVLQQMRLHRSRVFRDPEQGRAARQQLASALFADAAVPDAAAELVNRYSADTRTLDYFVLNATSLPPICRSDQRGDGGLPHRAPGRVPHAGDAHRRPPHPDARGPRRAKDDHRRGDRRRVRAHQGEPDAAGAAHHPPGRASRRR